MAIRRSGYATFNRQLWAFTKKTSELKQSMIDNAPGWTTTQSTALDTLLAALTAAKSAFPKRDTNP